MFLCEGGGWLGPGCSQRILSPSPLHCQAGNCEQSSVSLPPIKVMVALGEEDLSIKVCDP